MFYVVLAKDFDDILQSRNKGPTTAATATVAPTALSISSKMKKTISRGNSSVTSEPVQLDNGKWACNHRCKDKTVEGTDQPPKQSKKQVTEASNKRPQSGNCEAKSKIFKDNIKLERQVEVIDLTKPGSTKKLTGGPRAEKSSSKRKGRGQMPTLHHSYSRRTPSPLSDDTLDPLQLPLPARKVKAMKYTLSDGDDFEEFESLMGDFESSPTKNNISTEKEISQTSEHRSPTNNADFEDSGDLFGEDDAINDNSLNRLDDKSMEVMSSKNLDDTPCINTSQEKDSEGTAPAIQRFKADLLPLQAQSLQYNVDVLPTNQGVEDDNLFLTNPPTPIKGIPDTKVSGKENLDIFKLIPSKRRMSDSAATEIPLAEDNIVDIQHQQDSPRSEHLKQIDPLLLEEFGAVAEFY
ncbi:uncharacterized protein ARB_07456 [Trichophyton benhamiae CBS 112371]|uniref:Uncharacterized protein n=1 Tax=Arthroderma benhamiae (strain ATCC MYA-4681 / CBS 112371) TaxID=663331 RepID=D4AT92_ARTBC|nr:uncharacterized protein ARB_07456 [Trichophyton benhamiae CBS 112371]EFE33511.1 hypothetical protein ARB_07456 [Trichophyton benhamiae CBS 112371]